MRVAVVGATGAVGREMMRILEERSFPLDELAALASPRSEGKALPFRGGEVRVQALTPSALASADLALVSAGAAGARGGLPEAPPPGAGPTHKPPPLPGGTGGAPPSPPNKPGGPQ